MPGVNWSANCFAASCAAARRLGSTSVARIDCETSMVSITTARLRGIRTSFCGPAMATVSSTSEATNSIAGRWRQRLGRCGATFSRSSIFANRRMRFWRDSWTMMYSAAKPATSNRNKKNHGWAKLVRPIGPSSGNVTGRPPWLPDAGMRRSARCRRPNRDRCVASSLALHSVAASGQPRRDGRRRHERSRPATARRS